MQELSRMHTVYHILRSLWTALMECRSSPYSKSGYWQVELSEENIPLTTFMVGPLGFYECIHMPFGLMNAPMTFQQLMESGLGDMHLGWCIIHLDNIIIF